MNWYKLSQNTWYHGTSRDFDTFDPSKSDSGNAWGPGLYLTPDRSDAEAWARKGGGKNIRVLEFPRPSGRIFAADGLIPVSDLPPIDAILGTNYYSKGETVPGALLYMWLERKLGTKAKVNQTLKNIGYEALSYVINRGREMQHLVRL